jgi:phage terminase large subunit-like protein
MIDSAKVKEKILDLAKLYKVQGVVFDSAGAFVLANEIGNAGLTVFRCPMTPKYMSEPMKEFARAVGEKKISHDGGSWLRYCLANTRTDTDTYGQVRPNKITSKDKIDGAIGCFLAFTQILNQEIQTKPKSRYDNHEIDFV